MVRTAHLHRLLGRRGLLRGALGLELGELLLGLHVAGLGAQRREPRVERRVGELLPEVGLGDGVLDVLADVVEGFDLGVHREPLELLLDAHARLRRLHAGEHGVALGLELADVALHPDEGGLGAVGVALGGLGVGLELFEQRRELVLLLDEDHRQVVLVGLHGHVQLGLGLDHLGVRLLDPLVEVLAAPDDGRGRRLELRVLLDHRVDGVLVGDLGVRLLDVGDPQREEAAPQVGQAGEERHGQLLESVGGSAAPSAAGGAASGSTSLGEERTTRATATCPTNSRPCWTSSLRSLQARTTDCCSATRSSITRRTWAISSSSRAMRSWASASTFCVSRPPAWMYASRAWISCAPFSMIWSTGTPKAVSEASTICFLTAASVPAGSERSRDAALATRSCSPASIPAASKTAGKSTWPPRAAGGGVANASGAGSSAGVTAPSGATGVSGSAANGSAGAPSPSRTTNQPSTVDPQPRFSVMVAAILSLPPAEPYALRRVAIPPCRP